MQAKVVSDKGQPMMVMSKVGRKGSTLELTGQLMGAWPSKMYITPREFGKVIALGLRPGVILFVLLFPFLLVWDFLPKRKKED